ncbi:MAG: amino acid adenylation domain-containing protein, partial [Chloroflexi bacterium]|nr:amino acid adenylation domain-containing protein [Chloroflexota bacterium]
PNGKVDRKALPAPDARSTGHGELIAPRNPTEELVAGVWSAALGVEQLGVHDNFFALGGHSLMATQVIGRVKQMTSLDLPLRLLFEAPTVATFAARLQSEQSDAGERLQPVPRDETPLPLSFAQQRLWFLDQLEPNSTAYNLMTVARLHGSLNLDAFHRSLASLTQRHESLRTVFAEHLGEPVQMILPSLDVPLNVVSIQSLPQAERESALKQVIRDEAERPFDLKHGPLLRAQIVQLGDLEHVLLLTIHHSVSDGWSQGILLHELTTLYQGFVQHEPAILPELPIQYADYAVWQRQWLSGAVLEQQIDYWRTQLANLAPLELPTDYPRPPLMSYAGAHTSFKLAPELSADLQRLSQQLGVTLFMTLLAGFQTLLSRYSGQSDIAVGTPIAGRVRPELEGLIGFFVNTLVLRTDLSGQPAFEEVVQRVRNVSLGAYAHQELPFEVVVERLQPTRDLSRSPLFQVMFALQNMPRAAIELPDLTLEPIAPDLETAQFDLTLTLVEEPDGLHGQAEYRTDLFEAATIAQMIEHYQALLTAVVADPKQSIGSLPLPTEAERLRLADWNTVAAPPETQHFHELFAAQAARTPNAVAVVQGSQHVTYAQLNARANQLAHYLRTHGVDARAKGESIVGVCLPSSIELVVAFLAIFKAGATYLPLDPGAPRDRLDFMLQDVQAAVVITDAKHQEQVPASAARVVCLDGEQAAIDQESTVDPALSLDPDALAYIIYTSGSTGRPKGVGIAHGTLAQHISAMRDVYEFSAQDRVLKFAAPSFDVSIEEICWPLSGGAALVIRDSELWAPEAFTEIIAQAELTVVHLPPVYYRAWVQTFSEATTVPPALRLVTVGGEALTPEVVQIWQQSAFGKLRLINAYGPTETTITATVADLSADDYASAKRRNLPIGRVIGGRTAYIVGDDGQIAPLGMPGELWLGGAGLARGYLNRPDLTAAQFSPDPFSQNPGSRLYRTGDLARFLADGTIEYLGRIDQQVKVRGYRIELGEIEAALRQYPEIRDAAVVVRNDQRGEARLVAYVVGENQEPRTQNQEASELGSRFLVLGSDALRAFLRERLPEYMLPSAFVVLEALPLTPTQKIDRQALPEPDLDQLSQRAEFVAPRTSTETTLAGIWAEVLHLEQIGIHDDFFNLGGHSLLATQVVARIRELFHLELPVRTLFEHPTIAGLAQHIEQAQWSAGAPGAEIDLDDDEEEWEI